MPVEYTVVRHSERLDHYYGESWRERCHEQEFLEREITVPMEHAAAMLIDQPNTTPLSRHGIEYARQSGVPPSAPRQAAVWRTAFSVLFDLVITSPMLR